MLDLSAKYMGFSLLTWIIFGVIILYVSYTMYKKLSKNCLKKDNVEESVVPDLKSDKKIIVFYAKWCGFSKKFMGSDFKSGAWSQIKSAAEKMGYQVEEYTDEDQKMNQKYQINGYPTVVIENGNNVKNLPGNRTAEDVIAELD